MTKETITQYKSILKKYWGYDDFRGPQQAVLDHIQGGNNTLAILPTGGGKSICYQIPAVTMDGIGVVVSPLISLMKDQVESLRANGKKASFLNSSLSSLEQRAVEDDIFNNNIDRFIQNFSGDAVTCGGGDFTSGISSVSDCHIFNRDDQTWDMAPFSMMEPR